MIDGRRNRAYLRTPVLVPPLHQETADDRVDHDRLVLSACHPLYSAAKRIIVFARLERAELS